MKNLATEHPAEVREKVRLQNYSALIKDFVGSALASGFANAAKHRA